MTNTNDFVPFGTGTGANVLAASAWAAMTNRQLGFQSGTAPSIQVNTAIRQAAFVAAMVAQFTADNGPSNVQDNGNLATLEGQFETALTSYLTPIFETLFDSRYSKYVTPESNTFYVNASTGSDSNAGTSGAPFATIQGAITAIASKYLTSGQITINVANGTYGGYSVGNSYVASWNIVCASSSVIINATSLSSNNGRGIVASAGAIVTHSGGTISSYYENAQGNGGHLILTGGVYLTGTSNAPCVAAYAGGSVSLFGAINVSGSGQCFAFSGSNSLIQMGYHDAVVSNPVTITFSGTPAYSSATVIGQSCGLLQADPSMVTFSGSVTGIRYIANENGLVNSGGSGGTFFPGNSSGSTATGGQYF